MARGSKTSDIESVPLVEVKEDKNEAKSKIIVPLVHSNPRSYKGRLGYACLNTILRSQKPPVFCSRTCRLDTVKKKGIEYVKELALQNVEDIKALIEWNEAHGIKFMRMSSDIFPFSSHDDIGYELDFAKNELAEIGELAAKYNHRLTTHPGQYNQLGSPNPLVVARTVKDLHYHATMLDYMGLPPDSIMIIHMGGMYGDKPATLSRFEENYKNLPEHIKRRLVLENDELCYSVSDLLPVCQKLDIPLVLDWHHHSINPGEATGILELLPAINATWTRRGLKPKQHYSESRPGAVSAMERRAHSDRVKTLPPCTDDVDLMIEAKDKEQAVLELYKLYGLGPVDEEAYIPQKGVESKNTKGRKSSKKKKPTEEVIEEAVNEVVEVIETRAQRRKRVCVEETTVSIKEEEPSTALVKSKKRTTTKNKTKKKGT
ncbi:UV-endonuclease UvdE-domain-containing protein [Radiomyces spectabilis]|uniref:UV-endonuclease UvdE-domain-containing protein n=1 Tax=Radiomyces spectabilis TaxID=64574 RepID=UPI00221E78D8|nr:UV-endonuclease UvdE-domain-containing protein [Radiomyces spectabilis]KAI8374451.1 UV-endonuclease UvdE-domain-containing protein [Radiomyces spectabilis]